ncbi:MAG: ABC transporter substrate-binding protein, partial [Gammaproteobacteria bacterium]|nr:ABC transporter substrate-binding protein [Gammaproteobacteria bacterium]NIT64573.1 ABC transporter substrate-binding protein [Gammaproteobacteria bacterium]NIV21508.1 ABC transporter substrate-binding protein [Gammaproteobacteria bacterium]NIY33153.1 ABC transporter substrate-binding protein [Gammaproteobacteria bacterium]
MRWFRLIPAVLTAALLMTLTPVGAVQAAECEVSRPVKFAGLDWQSNAFHVEVARFIMEKGYGCSTDSIPGSTIPLLQGMARGDLDVTMELWRDNVEEAWAKIRKANQAEILGVNFPDAIQGWFVPRYLVEGSGAKAPGLKAVSDLPKYKQLFRDPEEPSKGRFYNCILGWGCEVINTNKLKGYGLLSDYTNFRPGTG